MLASGSRDGSSAIYVGVDRYISERSDLRDSAEYRCTHIYIYIYIYICICVYTFLVYKHVRVDV